MARNTVKKYVQDTVANMNPGKMIIDVGAGDEPNYYAPIFAGSTFHRLDIVQNKSNTIDIIADVYELPEDLHGQYDIVLSLETLEHLAYPTLAVQSMANLLKTGGLFLLSSVTCWGEHRHPKDYWRFLPDGFELILTAAGLKILEIKIEKVNAALPGGILAKAIKI